MRAIRWAGESDRRFAPFTYARETSGRFGIVLTSGRGDDDDCGNGCYIRFHAFGHTLIVALPQVIKPHREWVDTSRYEWSRGPGSGYWQHHARDYGFCFINGALHIDYGRQTHSSDTDQSKVYFLPWREWRHVRHSLYDLDGRHFADSGRTVRDAIEAACPVAKFEFEDYDGERIVATCKIEERQWKRGVRWFKWLSLLWPDKVRRSLDLRFSSEVGRRKGSWKGGTIGHGIDMLPSELHEAAFRRYCAQEGLTFVGIARDSDTHRMAETAQTGSGRSLSSAGRQASPEKPNKNT